MNQKIRFLTKGKCSRLWKLAARASSPSLRASLSCTHARGIKTRFRFISRAFPRVPKNLDFRDTSRNSVEQFEQRTDRRLIAAASADGVGKDFFEPCKIDELGSDLGEVSARNLPMRPCVRG
jgi:hypothetical protein